MIELDNRFYFVAVEQILDDLGIQIHRLQGDNLMCCCPIHGERNPSFGIHVETGVYNCFSCKAKGNIADLLRELRGYTLNDTKKYLAKFHTNNRPVPNIDIQTKITKYYNLDTSTVKHNSAAKDYLKSRKISNEIVDLFRIYDAQGKVVFPVYNSRNKCVGVQERAIENKRFKFSPGFDKNLNVYGIDVLCKYGNPDNIVYVTESIIDCLTLWSCGYQAVSIFSALMTEDHVKILAQTPFRFIGDGLDRDLAGRLGWERAEDLLRSKGLVPVVMPDHGKKDINELDTKTLHDWVKV